MAKTALLTATASLLALAVLPLDAAASAQSQGVTTDGSISGSIGELTYEGGIPALNPPDPDLFNGAYYTAAPEGSGLTLQVRMLSVGSGSSIRRSPVGFYGDDAVQLELVFEFPQDTDRSAISADMITWSSMTFVEAWPSRVPSPALQYATLFSQPTVSIDTFDWTEAGLALAGSVSGEACLHVRDTDERGDHVNSQARVMGETPCPEFSLEFSATATESHP